MNTALNLATQPFENTRRFYVLALTTGVLLVTATTLLAGAFARNYTRVRALSRQTTTLRAQMTQLEEEQGRLEGLLHRPEATDVMERSAFLNSLLRRKAVSWTRIFMDLEQVIPDRVQVVSVRPVAGEESRAGAGAPATAGAKAGEVELQMTVAAENLAALLDLLRRMEKSQKFYDPVVRVETPPQPGSGDNLFQMQVNVLYAQK